MRGVLAAIESPRVFWFKLMNRQMVAFSICRNLYQFAQTEEAGRIQEIVDIGANKGQFAKIARFCWPRAFIDSYEPDALAGAAFVREHGADRRIRLHQFALGEKAGILTIHCGSTSEQNSALIEIQTDSSRTFEVRVERLDDVANEGRGGVRMVKIDVQGFEMHVLGGAEAFLQATQFVLVEVSLMDMFVGGAKPEEIWSWLRQHGFDYRAVLDCYYDPTTGTMLQMDVLFRKRK